MERFLGGSPAAVIVKLIIASVIVGVVLSFVGFDIRNLYVAFIRLGHWLSSLSLDTFEGLARYLALGAMIVIPIWLISRFLSVLGNDHRPK